MGVLMSQWDRISRKINAIPERLRQRMQPTLMKSAEEVQDLMQRLAPVDDGDLKRSIVITPGGYATPPYSQPGGSRVVPINAVAITAGNTDVRYAHLVEHGTRKAAPRRFFWPAVRTLRRRALGRIKREMRKAIREGWGS